MSEWVQTHLPCPDCGSSDALSINDEGWSKCFSCGQNRKVDGECEPRGKPRVAKDKSLIPFGEYRALSKRKITFPDPTCSFATALQLTPARLVLPLVSVCAALCGGRWWA